MRLVDAAMIPPVLVELAQQFGALSFLTIGGVNAIIPEIHRRVVDIEHWLTDVEFAQVHDELMAHGTIWVGVSAQPVGIAGGPSMAMPGLNPSPLKTWDPVRYEPLTHPGDDYSYDIFSQAAAALLHPQGADPLAGAPLRALIAGLDGRHDLLRLDRLRLTFRATGFYDGCFAA